MREEAKHDGVWDERKGYPLFFLCVFLLLPFPFLCSPCKYSTPLFETTLSPGRFFRPTFKAREKRPGDEVVIEIAMFYSKILDGDGSFGRIRKVRFYDNQKDMLGVLLTCLGLHNIAELFYRQGAFPKC